MTDYDFPSRMSDDVSSENELYKKIYLGEEIDLALPSDKKEFGKIQDSDAVKVAKSLIHLDIPLDMKKGVVGILGYTKGIKAKLDTWESYSKATDDEKSKELKKIKRQIRERKLSNYIAFFGFTVTTASLLISPSAYLLGLFSLHSILLATFMFVANKQKVKPWGNVFDKATGNGLSRTLVRIFDKRFGKLLMTQVTVAGGKYGFIVDTNKKYLLTCEKKGYYMPDDHIEASSSREGLIKTEVALKKGIRVKKDASN